MSIADDKADLRARVLAAMASLDPADRAARSARAVDRLLTLPALARARSLMAYWPLPDEPDALLLCRRWLDLGKRLAAPRAHWPTRTLEPAWVGSLETGWETARAGVRQPDSEAPRASLADIDALVAPGVAFDGRRRRLGRGAGFYDRLLDGGTAPRPLLVALALEEQIVDAVPTEPHDAIMDVVVTESRTLGG
jgi:5-formyltetrahydrofolate cyclo-ligase